MLKNLLRRIVFITKHRTLRKIVLDKAQSCVLIFYKGRVVKLPRRCPHQGAPMEEGYFYGKNFVCAWHGCKFSLETEEKAKPYCTTLSKQQALD